MQPLANFQLKYNDLGSTFQKRNITPAEMLVLVAMFHNSSRDGKYTGENLIDRLVVLPEDHEKKSLKPLYDELEAVEKQIEELAEIELTEEIRERRSNAYLTKLTSLQERIQVLEQLVAIRNLDPATEVNRLQQIYGEEKVSSLLPGAIPSLPSTHKEAIELGMKRKFTTPEFGDMLTVTKIGFAA